MILYFEAISRDDEDTTSLNIDPYDLIYKGEYEDNSIDLSSKILSFVRNYELLSKDKDKIVSYDPNNSDTHCVFVVTPKESLYIDVSLYFIYRNLCITKYHGQIRQKQIKEIDKLILPILREKNIDRLLTDI